MFLLHLTQRSLSTQHCWGNYTKQKIRISKYSKYSCWKNREFCMCCFTITRVSLRDGISSHSLLVFCLFFKDAAASYDFNDNDPDPFPRYDSTNENKWVISPYAAAVCCRCVYQRRQPKDWTWSEHFLLEDWKITSSWLSPLALLSLSLSHPLSLITFSALKMPFDFNNEVALIYGFK